METLLVTTIVVITLAVITQAGILLAMYLMSRKMAKKAETLLDDSKKLLTPLQSIASNLKAVSEDLADTGKIAHEQMLHVQTLVDEAQLSVRGQIVEVRQAVLDTMDEARGVVMRPIRQYSALATGIAEGVRTFFFGRRRPEESAAPEGKHPAA